MCFLTPPSSFAGFSRSSLISANEETHAPRGKVICLRSHGEEENQSRFELGHSDSKGLNASIVVGETGPELNSKFFPYTPPLPSAMVAATGKKGSCSPGEENQRRQDQSCHRGSQLDFILSPCLELRKIFKELAGVHEEEEEVEAGERRVGGEEVQSRRQCQHRTQEMECFPVLWHPRPPRLSCPVHSTFTDPVPTEC
jgi:hypothetical protein